VAGRKVEKWTAQVLSHYVQNLESKNQKAHKWSSLNIFSEKKEPSESKRERK